MKFLLDNWMLILLALTSGGLLLLPTIKRSGGSAVNVSEAVRLINREKGVLIDVGEPAEFASGHATGARNVPLSRLDGAKELPTNKSLPLLVMCPSGGRSGRAVSRLRSAGYEKAVVVQGGTAAWRDASLPVERST